MFKIQNLQAAATNPVAVTRQNVAKQCGIALMVLNGEASVEECTALYDDIKAVLQNADEKRRLSAAFSEVLSDIAARDADVNVRVEVAKYAHLLPIETVIALASDCNDAVKVAIANNSAIRDAANVRLAPTTTLSALSLCRLIVNNLGAFVAL